MEHNQKTSNSSQDKIRNIISLVMAVSAVLLYAITIYGYSQTGVIDWVNVIVAVLSLLIAVKVRRAVKTRRAAAGTVDRES